MIRFVLLVNFADGAEPAAVQRLLAEAAGLFENGPLQHVLHGPPAAVLPNAADWGYTVDVATAEDITRWRATPQHQRLRELVHAVAGRITNFHFEL